MKKFLIATLIALATPALAADTEYHLVPKGNNNASGLTRATGWATMAKVNSTINTATNNGNVIVKIWSGVGNDSCGGSVIINTMPNPANEATGGFRYYFVPGCPQQIVRRTGNNGVIFRPTGGIATLNEPYVSMRGFYIDGSLKLATDADYDTIAQCTWKNNTTIQGADYSTLDSCTGNGDQIWFGWNEGDTTSANARSDGFKVVNCVFPKLDSNGATPNEVVTAPFALYLQGRLDSLSLWFNRFTITNKVGWSARSMVKGFYATNLDWRGNIMDCYQNSVETTPGSNEAQNVWMIREGCRYWSFNRDTLRVWGTPVNSVQFASGNCDANIPNECTNFSWDSSLVSVENGNAIQFYGYAGNVTATYSTFVAGAGHAFTGAAAQPGRMRGNNLIHHCTMVGSMPGNWSGPNGQCDQYLNEDQLGSANFRGLYSAIVAGDSTLMHSNIFGSFQPLYQIGAFDCDRNVAAYIQPGALEFNDWNVFYSLPYDSVAGDCSIGYTPPGGSVVKSAPGSGKQFALTQGGREARGRYGNPMFGNRSDWVQQGFATFNASLGEGSAAIGAGKSGTDAGAVAYVTKPIYGIDRTTVQFYAGSDEVDTLTITNSGTGDLALGVPSVSTGGEVSAVLAANTIAAGASTTMRVALTPVSGGRSLYQVSFSTNDPLFPVARTTVTIDRPPANGQVPFE